MTKDTQNDHKMHSKPHVDKPYKQKEVGFSKDSKSETDKTHLTK